ncbi:MAG: peptidoglycan editing factor PgeF [Prevotella sp.]|nr:peptidoglycan editing factor PgeF [Prevotella sp.]
MKQPKLVYYDLGTEVTAFSTTRHGGYSKGNYAELNINRFCGDDEACIRKNREALCTLLGISDDRLLMPHQVHLTKVARIDEALLSLSEEQRREALEGYDALMTNLEGVCIGVSTADCIPILLYDKAHHAVCAIHAGWRGTVARIAEKAIAEMEAAYGTQPLQLVAQIGPGIHQDSFEVGDEVYEAFVQVGFDMPSFSRRQENALSHQEKWHLDLPECNRQQLMNAGIPAASISVSPICTFEQADRFFSARKLGISSGRIFTGIVMNDVMISN